MLIEQETSSLCFDLRQTYIIAQNCSIVPNHCDVEKNRTKHTKRSMAFSNGHLTSVIKRRSCLLFLGQTFLFVSLISWHHRWQKTVFFAFEFEFIILLEEGGGGGILRKITGVTTLTNVVWPCRVLLQVLPEICYILPTLVWWCFHTILGFP